MLNALPMFFIALAALALILTLLWLWQSLRLAFVHVVSDEPAQSQASRERSALLAEKRAALLALKDLEGERDAGKLSQEDFVELNDQYRTRARVALQHLDALLAPHRAEAHALIAKASTAPAADGGGTSSAADGGGAARSVETEGCLECGTSNDPDAVFCKKCGTRLGARPNA
jgi:ribosomal protein L40E